MKQWQVTIGAHTQHLVVLVMWLNCNLNKVSTVKDQLICNDHANDNDTDFDLGSHLVAYN